ncbi:MAG: hypothetical protein PHU94_05600 [Bacilli bacterium]|nr:hypothetical protein [Bacilli bacterium]
MNKKTNIKKQIDYFLKGKGKSNGRYPNERYCSFDFCYNYFYSFYKKNKIHDISNKENMQMSCLQLGFYLASWGMMRGGSFLLQKSVKNFSNLIRVISEQDHILWEIDVPSYGIDKNIYILLDIKEKIKDALGKENSPSDTLITKIMLGVFANVPAFDRYFKKSIKVNSLNKKSLSKIYDFYLDNKKIIDSYNFHTYDFNSEKEIGGIVYTKAKIIDMYAFMDGQNKNKIIKNDK